MLAHRLVLSPLLLLALLATLALGCGSPPPPSNGPKTAVEKQRLEAKSDPDLKPPAGKKWSGWRYKGHRDECFFLVGRTCFKTRDDACDAAACAAPKKCDVEDGGPSIVSCK